MKSLEELQLCREDYDFEVKRAQGRDGTGEVPSSMWQTYSAMANSEGGIIVLGAGEDAGRNIFPIGLKNLHKVQKMFWDSINNPTIVNTNLLVDRNVSVLTVSGRSLLCIEVPRAQRQQRPVFVGGNPLTGTYRRNYEGDYKCDEDTVRRMLAEAVEDTRDARLLADFGIQDLDPDSLTAYRNELRSTRPGHPWLALNDRDLLRNLGGWRRGRVSGEEGLTVAGLLMFGRLPSILEALPYYIVDYQERPLAGSGVRWVDRLTTDGTWSGNLFDFFRRTYARLTIDLKVPFRLQESVKRIDETNVHEALREALVNTITHADYSGRIPILVVKRQDFFGFSNPGGLRLPLAIVLLGGVSDCRNRILQKMFQMIGVGEQAGSGFPKIMRAWQEQHWRSPQIDESYQPEQTVLRLPMISLLPADVIEELDGLFGPPFRALTEVERLAVVTARVEGHITNQRLRTITRTHPSDLTALLRGLVEREFLEPQGVGRGTVYHLPGQAPRTMELDELRDALAPLTPTPEGSESDSEPSGSDSEPSGSASEPDRLAQRIRERRKVPASEMEAAIMALCQDEFRTPSALATSLGRTPDTLRLRYLNRMVGDSRLVRRFPETPNHPQQAYRARVTFSSCSQ